VNDDPFAARWSPGSEHGGVEDQVIIGIAGVLVTNLLLVLPVLVLLRRWQLPFGSVAFLALAVALLPSAAHGFQHGAAGLLVAPVGGLVVDVLIRCWRPSPTARPQPYRLHGAILPPRYLVPYFLALQVAGGLGWPPELSGGAIGLASLSGLTLALVGGADEGRRGRRVALRSRVDLRIESQGGSGSRWRTCGPSTPSCLLTCRWPSWELNGADPVGPLGVIGIAWLAFAIGITILATTSDPYESIGGGVFDRSRGDDGERPPPDAEYEEFAVAIALYCAREEARQSAAPSARPEARARSPRSPCDLYPAAQAPGDRSRSSSGR
jgi:hypothetical protein